MYNNLEIKTTTNLYKPITISGVLSGSIFNGWGVSISICSETMHTFLVSNFLSSEVQSLFQNIDIIRYKAGSIHTQLINPINDSDGKRMVDIRNSKFRMRYLKNKSATSYLNECLQLDLSNWNWENDKYQIEILKYIHKYYNNNNKKYQLYGRSPPWWLLKDGNPSGNGLLNNIQSNLGLIQISKDANNNPVYAEQTEKYYTDYLLTIYFNSKEKWGIEFDSISPFYNNTDNFLEWKTNDVDERCKLSIKNIELILENLFTQNIKICGLDNNDINVYDNEYIKRLNEINLISFCKANINNLNNVNLSDVQPDVVSDVDSAQKLILKIGNFKQINFNGYYGLPNIGNLISQILFDLNMSAYTNTSTVSWTHEVLFGVYGLLYEKSLGDLLQGSTIALSKDGKAYLNMIDVCKTGSILIPNNDMLPNEMLMGYNPMENYLFVIIQNMKLNTYTHSLNIQNILSKYYTHIIYDWDTGNTTKEDLPIFESNSIDIKCVKEQINFIKIYLK